MADTLNSTLAVIDALRQRFPGLHAKVDSPDADGATWYELALGKRLIVVEERPECGFGLHYPVEAEDYGVNPNEIVPYDYGMLLTDLTDLLMEVPLHG